VHAPAGSENTGKRSLAKLKEIRSECNELGQSAMNWLKTEWRMVDMQVHTFKEHWLIEDSVSCLARPLPYPSPPSRKFRGKKIKNKRRERKEKGKKKEEK
jgi:hypothetical protein